MGGGGWGRDTIRGGAGEPRTENTYVNMKIQGYSSDELQTPDGLCRLTPPHDISNHLDPYLILSYLALSFLSVFAVKPCRVGRNCGPRLCSSGRRTPNRWVRSPSRRTANARVC